MHFSRSRFWLAGLLFTTLAFVQPAFAQKPTDIQVEVAGYSNDTALLGYYMDGKTYIYDTLFANDAGQFEIKHDTAVQGGIYLFVLKPNNNYFEVLLNGRTDQFSLKTDSSDFIGGMEVKGSTENQLFYEFQKYALEMEQKIRPIRTAYDSLSADSVDADSAEVEELRQQLVDLDKEVRAFRKKLADENPETFLSTLYNLISEPELPDSLQNAEDDSTKRAALYWYRNNFFNGVNLSDPSLLRTPVLKPKLNNYLERMVPPHPDSAIKQADYLIGLAEGNPLTYRYVVSTVFNYFVNSKIMGMDQVYVHMAEEYYMDGKAPWAGEEFLQQLADRIPVLKTLLIGKPAPELVIPDDEGQVQFLRQQPYDYTVAFFYDPTCGHCQKSCKKLRTVVQSLEEEGISIGVYSVCTKPDEAKWKDFIEEYEIQDWVNVCDMYNTTGFREVYDIKSTPKVFVLDQGKNIMAKQLEPLQVEDLIRQKEDLPAREKEEGEDEAGEDMMH